MAGFDLIWPLGFGRQVSFFDRMQILQPLPAARFVVSVDALTYLHGKHRWQALMPETHASGDPETLLQTLAGGGQWVLKPTAGSYGRDVVLIEDTPSGRETLKRVAASDPGSYLILQRYVPEIRRGEKRTLVAGGELIGSYLRRPDLRRPDLRGPDSPRQRPQRDAGNGHGRLLKANLAAEASAEPTTLSAGEKALAQRLAAELATLGAGFAAVDTVGGYLMEVNVANPGGLGTLAGLGDAGASTRAVKALLRWKGLSC